MPLLQWSRNPMPWDVSCSRVFGFLLNWIELNWNCFGEKEKKKWVTDIRCCPTIRWIRPSPVRMCLVPSLWSNWRRKSRNRSKRWLLIASISELNWPQFFLTHKRIGVNKVILKITLLKAVVWLPPVVAFFFCVPFAVVFSNRVQCLMYEKKKKQRNFSPAASLWPVALRDLTKHVWRHQSLAANRTGPV